MTPLTPLVLTFTNRRTPELLREPLQDDPQGATLDLWLKYEDAKKYRWRGRAAMDDSRQVDALNSLKDDGAVVLRLRTSEIFEGDPGNGVPYTETIRRAAQTVVGLLDRTAGHLEEARRSIDKGEFDQATAAAASAASIKSLIPDAARQMSASTEGNTAILELITNKPPPPTTMEDAKKAVDDAKTAVDKAKQNPSEAQAAANGIEAAKSKIVAARAVPASFATQFAPNADLLIQVGNHRWALPGFLWTE